MSYTVGQEVYDLHGRSGRYVARAAAGHIVEPVYDTDDDGPHYDDPQTWREVFKTPPRERLHADIAEIEATLDGKRAQLAAVRAQVSEAEKQAADLRKRIASEPDLTDLDLWLQGKITHIVSLNYGATIGTVDEVLKCREDKTLRLLNLRVDPQANRFWVSIAGYSDGSGTQIRCLLATSLEHAKERLRAHIEQRERCRESGHDLDYLAAAAVGYGIKISDALAEKVATGKRKQAASQLKQAQDNAERARLQLEHAANAAAALGAQ